MVSGCSRARLDERVHVVADGDILDARTHIKHVFIEGRMIPLTSRHTELFDSFKDRKLEAPIP